jgi:hypothetical protein
VSYLGERVLSIVSTTPGHRWTWRELTVALYGADAWPWSEKSTRDAVDTARRSLRPGVALVTVRGGVVYLHTGLTLTAEMVQEYGRKAN